MADVILSQQYYKGLVREIIEAHMQVITAGILY